MSPQAHGPAVSAWPSTSQLVSIECLDCVQSSHVGDVGIPKNCCGGSVNLTRRRPSFAKPPTVIMNSFTTVRAAWSASIPTRTAPICHRRIDPFLILVDGGSVTCLQVAADASGVGPTPPPNGEVDHSWDRATYQGCHGAPPHPEAEKGMNDAWLSAIRTGKSSDSFAPGSYLIT